jgi:hypothetical protein
MKKFLKNLQDIQDECIDGVKKSKVSQLPGTVAGVTIHSVGQHISREEWNQMRENISQHSKDWRRFKNDPNKIVLEKNFFINCLNFMQGFYIFRPIDDNGKTYIKVKDSFFESKPKQSEWLSSLPIMLMIITILGPCLLSMLISNYFFFGLILIPLAFLIQKRNNSFMKKEEAKWQKSFTNRPGVILPSSVFSKKYHGLAKSECTIIEKNTRESLVKINLNESPFLDDYRAILSKTLEIARDTKGEIAWLWQFGPYTLPKDDFSITYQDFIGRTLDQTLCINIDVKSSNILPIIETDHSFIFCLDYFSDEMEQYYSISDGMIETLRKKTKNSSGTTINDDLFRLNEL